MTIRYSADVATSNCYSFYRILFRWKGSLWKAIIVELTIWIVLYYILKLVYTYAMDEEQRRVFEDFAIFCNKYSDFLPITFMLGFYVTAVFGRWQSIWGNIGWIDTPALAVSVHIKGDSEQARTIRRNIVRYLILVQALVFRDISIPVKKRLPTMGHLISAGFLSEEELRHFDSFATTNTKYYLPMQWALALLAEARDEGLLTSDMAMVDVTKKLYKWREQVVSLSFYNWFQVPLAYTQMVHLAVSTFFLAAIMGRQFLHPHRTIPGYTQQVDGIVPIFSILEFIFIVGWTKVAEIMLNPMGEDDDDFETNFLLNRNLQVGLALADQFHGAHPPLKKDVFWDVPVVEPRHLRGPEPEIIKIIPKEKKLSIVVRRVKKWPASLWKRITHLKPKLWYR